MAQVQKLLTYGGIKKQTALGAVAATPAVVGFGIASGQIVQTPIESAYEDLTLLGGTTSDRFAPAVYRTKIQPGAAFSTRAMPSGLASFMLAALGTDSSVTTTHTLTPALALPYWGIMGKFGAAPEVVRLNDAKCNTLTFAVNETDPVMLDMTWLGTSVTPDFTWTATNDDSVVAALAPFAGTFQFDVDSATPATEPISAFSVEINNNLEPVFLANAVQPVDIMAGRQTIEGSITVKVADLDEWQNIYTGTPAGTVAQATPLYGSFSLTVTNGTQSIVMTAGRVEFIADFPESDPGGGAAELNLAYRVIRPTGGTAAFTAVVINTLSGAIT